MATAKAEKSGLSAWIDKYFEISQRGSTIGTEVRGGLVTFITMAYIVVLNPVILSAVPDVAGTQLSFNAVSASTALVAGVITILFGFIARLPFAFAAGLGLNAFVAFTLSGYLTYAEAFFLVVINGVIIVILGATGLRTLIFNAVPMQLKIAITVGIGLFIALIGFVNGGFVTATGNASPPIGLGTGGSIASWATVVFIITLLTIGILYARKVKGAILIGIVFGTIVAVISNLVAPGSVPGGATFDSESALVALPDLSLVGAIAPIDFGRVSVIAVVMLLFTLIFTNFFDAVGTFTGLARQAGVADENGNFPRLRSALVVEGVGAVAGGAASASSNTVFVESSAGIGEGARTGLANIVTGVLFLLAMFLTPIYSFIPSHVASAALVAVGVLMMMQIKDIDWSDYSIALPVFLTVAAMPFTYSIAAGIGAGFISYVVVRSLSGKGREISPLLWICAAGFVIYFAHGPIEAWISSLAG